MPCRDGETEMTRNSTLYPAIEPFHTGMLPVSDRHTLYFEQVGNPAGRPIVFLHGGPGGGVNPSYRRYFDPRRWHIILFDQRGCGRSTPFAETRDNTTWDLVADIERLREHLELDRWAVFGGSWGSTLALTWATSHPDRCTALFLRGIFLLRRKEIQWFYQEGCSRLFPDLWEEYLAPIPAEERHDLVAAYHRRLQSDDPVQRREAARAWSRWEGATSKLQVDPAAVEAFGSERFADAFARIESHYFANRGFFDRDDYLLQQAHRIRHIPTVIVHGRYDVICPVQNAWDLHRELPDADLHIIPDAGHSLSEPGITQKLIEYTDRWGV